LFGDAALSPVVLCILGVILYEHSVGFYLTATGSHTARESVIKVLRLPSLYAFFAGILLNALGFPIGDIAVSTVGYFKGAYAILGMMLVGMGLATMRLRHIDAKFISLALFSKFVVWPLAMGALVFWDRNWGHAYDPVTHNSLLLLGLVPLAANTVAFAAELGVHPDKAALAVLLSTVIALFYLPWMAGLLMAF
jgi:predicted permease